MNLVSLQSCMKKKPFSVLLHCRRYLSSHKFKQTTESNKLDKALRVLDIISPKLSVVSGLQNHLRLVQDFCRTDSMQFDPQRCGDGFSGVSSVFDEILESSFVNEELVYSVDCEMDQNGWRIDASVLSNAVSLCRSVRDLREGIGYHCVAIKTGFISSVYVGSSLISFYCRFGDLVNAHRLFDEMPVKNVVSWTAIISGFAQESQVDVCLELYSMMRISTSKPNDFTFTTVLTACTGEGAFGQGRSAHCQTIQMGFDSYLHISNALISMYCKCGSLEDAYYIFHRMCNRDIVSWNSIIAGYAQHGLANEAISLFEEMRKTSIDPDAITFLGVLSSCRHAGFVNEGRFYFNAMIEYGVKPELDHYSCVVDLLGRARLLKEAKDFIENMPICANSVIWGSLLSSCRVHGNVWIGIEAAEKRLLLEPECGATHVQLANLYASVGYWNDAARVRKSMKDKGLKPNPGCSWIEIKNQVFSFQAEDKANTRFSKILAVLDCLAEHMTSFTIHV